MSICGLVLWILTWLLEYGFFYSPRILDALPFSHLAQVRRQIGNQTVDDHILTLSKCYGTKKRKKLIGVNKLCLGIRSGEYFGLDEVNGAGKTTTFRMLTGDLRLSAGSSFVHGSESLKQRREVFESIGYCPSLDALLDELSEESSKDLFGRNFELWFSSYLRCTEITNRLMTRRSAWMKTNPKCTARIWGTLKVTSWWLGVNVWSSEWSDSTSEEVPSHLQTTLVGIEQADLLGISPSSRSETKIINHHRFWASDARGRSLGFLSSRCTGTNLQDLSRRSDPIPFRTLSQPSSDREETLRSRHQWSAERQHSRTSGGIFEQTDRD